MRSASSPTRRRRRRGRRRSKRWSRATSGRDESRLDVRTKHGVGYVAERPWNDSTQVLNERGEPTAISFDRDLIFKADVYSQNEIEEIATNSSLQLSLLDKFIDEDIRRLDGELHKLRRSLTDNAEEMIRIDEETRDLRDSASEVAALADRLKGLQKAAGPDAKAVNEGHALRALREKERKSLEALRGDLRKAKSDVDSTMSALVRRLDARVDDEMVGGPNKAVFDAVNADVRELTRLLERVGKKIGEQAEATDATVAQQQHVLADRHAKQDAAYRQLVEKCQEESGRAAERAQAQERHAEAVAAGKELELRQKERREHAKRRAALVTRLSALLDERFRLRKDVADNLSAALKPTIRVTIAQAAGRTGYHDLLCDALKGQSLKYTGLADRIVQRTSPSQFAALVHRGDAARLAEAVRIDEERARKIIAALQETTTIYEIETVELEDAPRIELRDGPEYKDSTGLSTGQRCTTILPILLLESERPLLIDQPEDNLDNAFIYETVVKSLKGAKGRRQLIFVTHNPNIPVLGDAERVFVMASDGTQARVTKVGTVDEVKGDIELLLEGGREAFRRRMEKYGH